VLEALQGGDRILELAGDVGFQLRRRGAGQRMDVDGKTPLVSVATLAGILRVQGHGRGGKSKDELLKGAALDSHVGKRARKGRKIDGFVKPQRLLAG
jgi:hypothetical protein